MKKAKVISSILFDSLTKQYHALEKKLFFAPLAFQKFLELGLPTKQHSFYKNIGLQKLNDIELLKAQTTVFENANKKGDIHLQNGQLVFSNDVLSVQTIEEASPIFGSFLHGFYSTLFSNEKDSFYAIATALSNGIVIHVPKDHKVVETVRLLNETQLKKNESCFVKIILILEKGAKLNLSLEHFFQEHLVQNSGFCFLTIDVICQENAKCHIQEIELSQDQNTFSFLRANQKRDSLLKTLLVTKGSQFNVHDFKVNLLQPNAECFLNGLWLTKEKNQVNCNVFVEHISPYCRSHQYFKGIVHNRAKSTFEGEIYVHQEAQKTDAFQLNQNLVLSEDAKAISKPKLEIFADDVKASHGSTTAQIDQEVLFYLQTRGIDKSQAKALLIEAFLKEMLDKIKVDEIKTQLQIQANQFYEKALPTI